MFAADFRKRVFFVSTYVLVCDLAKGRYNGKETEKNPFVKPVCNPFANKRVLENRTNLDLRHKDRVVVARQGWYSARHDRYSRFNRNSSTSGRPAGRWAGAG